MSEYFITDSAPFQPRPFSSKGSSIQAPKLQQNSVNREYFLRVGISIANLSGTANIYSTFLQLDKHLSLSTFYESVRQNITAIKGENYA